MKSILVLIITLVCTNAVFPQESVMSEKEQRALAKEKRKADKLAEEEQARKITEYMIQNQKFVLEADFIAGHTGARYPVVSNLNFIIVDSTEAVIQIGSTRGMGYNGVGGITIDGRITKYELKEHKTKRGVNYSIRLYINSSLGPYDIQFWITPSGNADATIRGNYSGSVTYSGRLILPQNSRIYKGMSST